MKTPCVASFGCGHYTDSNLRLLGIKEREGAPPGWGWGVVEGAEGSGAGRGSEMKKIKKVCGWVGVGGGVVAL